MVDGSSVLSQMMWAFRAMGMDEGTAACALRVSLGPQTTEQEVLRFADAFIAARRKQRNRAA